MLARCGAVYNQQNLPATSSQYFPFLCGWFIFNLLQETNWAIMVVLGIPLENNLIIILGISYIVLHFIVKCIDFLQNVSGQI